jgi:hypothetical protein
MAIVNYPTLNYVYERAITGQTLNEFNVHISSSTQVCGYGDSTPMTPTSVVTASLVIDTTNISSSNVVTATVALFTLVSTSASPLEVEIFS